MKILSQQLEHVVREISQKFFLCFVGQMFFHRRTLLLSFFVNANALEDHWNSDSKTFSKTKMKYLSFLKWKCGSSQIGEIFYLVLSRECQTLQESFQCFKWTWSIIFKAVVVCQASEQDMVSIAFMLCRLPLAKKLLVLDHVGIA